MTDLSYISEALRPLAVQIDSLHPDPANARTKHAVDRIAASLKSYGQRKPIVVNRSQNNKIEAGNGTWQAMKANGCTHIAAVFVDDDAATAAAYGIADNRVGEFSEWDADVLADLVQTTGDLFTGFTVSELDDLMPDKPGSADAEPQIDRAAELNQKWQVVTGDLWQIGEHRLLCGDSTKREDVERVMGGEKCSLIVTDPPYGVDYVGGLNDTKREKLSGDEDALLYNAFLEVIPSDDKCALYMWHAGTKSFDVYKAAIDNGFTVRSQIIWHKLKAHYGNFMAQYMQKHEPCVYCVKNSPEFSGPTNEVTVWEYDQPSTNEFHPTQKPVVVMQRAISNHPYILVYEPFAGSGTTLVACQNLSRKCRAIEISPNYCAVILERMATAFPGIVIERVEPING